jgi:ribulose 1,5-bisphosphate synthetase/thiazole synthase
MKFYVVIDATGHPAVVGEVKMTHMLEEGMEVDVSDTHDCYDRAMEAVAEMRSSRSAITA